MITIGRMAERFHMLPSQVEANASTYDFMIIDVLATWDKYEQGKKKGGTLDPSVYKISTDQLLSIMGKNKK